MGNGLLLQMYARDYLLRMDTQLNPIVIEEFLADPAFAKLANIFECKLSEALKKFRDEVSHNTDEIVPPVTSQNPHQPVAQPAVINAPVAPHATAPASAATENVKPLPIEEPNPTPVDDKTVEMPKVEFDIPATDSINPIAAASTAPTLPSTATDIVGENMPAATDPPPIVPSKSVIMFRLPNARAGDVYSQPLTPLKPLPQPIIFTEIKLPDDSGLSADLATGIISGTPSIAGESDIHIIFHFVDDATASAQTATVPLLVNPNPKLMWKNLPSDEADIYWKPDEQCSVVTGADLRVLAASKRGRSHAHVGSFRDDDYVIDYLKSGWYVAVVSDGAGSAKFSRRGAQIICQESAAHLNHVLDNETGQAVIDATEAFHNARNSKPLDTARIEAADNLLRQKLYLTVAHAAHRAAKAIQTELTAHPEQNASTRDFSSTAIISISRRFPFGTLCAAYWVGDGAVGVYSKTSGITLLGDADSGEFSGQTRFLDGHEVTPEALWKRTRFVLTDDITAFILMTDGVSDPMFDTEANLARRTKWDELWNDIDRATGISAKETGSEQRLLSWLDFWSQGNHDDRTIAIVYQEN